MPSRFALEVPYLNVIFVRDTVENRVIGIFQVKQYAELFLTALDVAYGEKKV